MTLVADRAGIASGRRRRSRLLAAVAVALAAAGLFACYLRVAATYATGADGASNALEAWDLLHGNWLLRGWTLTDVSFYPTELPEYALAELARGLRPDVVQTCAAVTYTLLVLAAAALARGRARGREGWARALLAAGIMLAPQLGNGVHVLLAQPDHVGTQVLLLGIFLLVDRGRRRWYTVAAVGALLTVAVVADKIALVDAGVPLAFAGALHAGWGATAGRAARRGSAGRPARPALAALRGRGFELALAAAAGCAAVAGQLVLTGISRLGGFALLPVQTGMTTQGRVPGHLAMAWQDTLNLFGADVTVAPPGPQTLFAWLHAPGIALAAAAFGLAVWRVPCPDDLVSDVLAIGLVVNVAGFVASVIPTTPFDARELAAALPYGAVLAGRVFGPSLAGAVLFGPRPAGGRTADARPAGERSAGARFGGRWRGRVRPGVAALALAGGCQVAALGYAATRPAAVSPEQALAGWLAAHHLTTGLGTYSEDNTVTLDSGGAVQLLTVSWHPRPAATNVPRGVAAPDGAPAPDAAGTAGGTTGGTVARLYSSSASWYDPATADATFIVTGAADGAADRIPRAEILALAGPPARSYQVGEFTVMVWHTNLLALLGAPPSRLPGIIGRP